VSHQDDANLKVIISRIQQRRGLKQDLPHPLRPGEIGFATDSRQVYIGADTDDTISKTYNKTVYLENTLGAQARSLNIANTQIVKFEVPHIRFVKGSGTFDGVSKTQSWVANTSTSYNLSDNSNVARTTFDITVANSGNSVVNQNRTAKAFDADDITVLIDGKKQLGDSSGTGATVNASYDYNFVSGNATGDSHTLYLRTAPTNSQQVAITYYGNSHVNHAIANSVIANGATVTGFHTQMSIPEYRYLNAELVLVNPETGSGFIGLETKHIDVVQEGSGIANVADVTLGNVVLVKDPLDPALFSPDPANSSLQIYTGISNVSSTKSGTVHGGELSTFDMGADSVTFTAYANASGGYNGYVWLEGQSGSAVAGNTQIETQHYFHQKLLPIEANSVGTTFTVSTPANAFQTARAVTTTGSGTITVAGNVEGLTNGDKVRFVGANATNFTNAPYTISSLNAGAGTFQVTESGQTTSIPGGLDFINHGGNVANVQIFSLSHGIPTTSNVVFSAAVGAASANTEVETVGDQDTTTNNTFFVSAASVTANVTGNMSPFITNLTSADGLTVKPAYLLDLSGTSTLNGAIALVNGKQQWFRVSLKPDINDQIYIYSNDQTQYRLFDDPQNDSNTWTALGLSEGHFTRKDHTVKSKLEKWFKNPIGNTSANPGVLGDEKVNILSNVFINEPYSTETFDSWLVDIDTTNGEIDFNSNDEAGHFAEIVNKLYFNTTNPDKRGLTTVKTNIELLTTAAQESGQSVSTFTQPQQLSIGTGNVTLTNLGSDASIYDTLYVDYSLVGTTLDPSNANVSRYYNRVGTLMYHGNPSADVQANGVANGVVTINDISTENKDANITGNLSFSASMANGTISIGCNNDLTPTTSNVVMKYIVRRWKSQ
jgi:hypothetical protein|tara:strand:+ start:34547 stop:37210 length:2664 start_codon:yes stop_codon:yes gene_type:complete